MYGSFKLERKTKYTFILSTMSRKEKQIIKPLRSKQVTMYIEMIYCRKQWFCCYDMCFI